MLIIITPSGAKYKVNEAGDIIRTDMDHTPSGQWKLKGIENVKSNEYYPFEKLTPELPNRLQLL